MLLGVPNISEGRDDALVERIAGQFSAGAKLLDSHSDPVHNRTVLTLAGDARWLGESLARGAGACLSVIDMTRHEGAHPCIGALDVCPVVWLRAEDRETAAEVARSVARTISRGGVPVFLYGELASTPARRERAFFREGGLPRLRERMASGELHADLGPDAPHARAGAALVTARPPLAAFNVMLAGATLSEGRLIAERLRESGGGLPGVRAIAVDLGEGRTQISTNVHDPIDVPLAQVVESVRAQAAEHGSRPAEAEIVGLVPEAALAGFPEDVPLPAFDPQRHVIERAT